MLLFGALSRTASFLEANSEASPSVPTRGTQEPFPRIGSEHRLVVNRLRGRAVSNERPATLTGVWGAFVFSPGAELGAERPKLKTLEDRTALVEVWWLSPAPFRDADRFLLGNSANPPFDFPRSDTNRNH